MGVQKLSNEQKQKVIELFLSTKAYREKLAAYLAQEHPREGFVQETSSEDFMSEKEFRKRFLP